MRYILSAASRPILTHLANERTLCAFDFDGTLAPIVEHPDQAGMHGQTLRLLARLAALFPCIILSGRKRTDVLGKLHGVAVERVFGSHGAESPTSGSRDLPGVQRWKAVMEAELGTVPGLWVEDKGLSLAVHYRQSPQRSEVRRQILRAARSLEGARVFGGKFVVNLTADSAPNKGTVLAAERERLRCNPVLYVGDDVNDEDAFAIGGDIVPVRIGKKLGSHARYYLRTQSEIDVLLERLAALREQRNSGAENSR